MWDEDVFADFFNIKTLYRIAVSIFLVGGFFVTLAFLINNITPYKLFLNEGYSMCVYEDPLLEILPIHHSKCTWVPLNILILNTNIDKTALGVGQNVCYLSRGDILVCHRITKKYIENGTVYYKIDGLHPDALEEDVPADRIYGVPIDKLPRGVGSPTYLVSTFGLPGFVGYFYITTGGYT